MAKQTLTANTPNGTFTRTTGTSYTHVVVRECKRSMDVFKESLKSGEGDDGVYGRWIKDRGYAVTWHGSESAANNAAAKPYGWANSTVLGVFPVSK